MSNINIKRFVDINIVHHQISSSNATRDVVVLLSNEGNEGTVNTYESLQEYLADGSTSTLTNTSKYAATYFANGGNKLKVVRGITNDNLADTIKALPNEEIVVAYVGDYSSIMNVAVSRESDTSIYGINQKILLGRTSSVDENSIQNFAVKYSTEIGAEMTIAAYLSNINVDGTDTVQDYAFTKEVLAEEEITDSVYGSIIDNNMNVDIYLAGATRNMGGNLKDGKDLVNEYVLIILHQTLTDRLIDLLTQKIKGVKGLASVSTIISQELNRYITNGFLATNKTWTDRSLTVVYNNHTYTVINANTPLLKGYTVTVLPFTALTEQDKAQKKMPPIYLILATSYGIRKITINGEVI